MKFLLSGMASIGRPTAIKYHTGLFLVFIERLGYIDYNYQEETQLMM
jgi:hypothetical protein